MVLHVNPEIGLNSRQAVSVQKSPSIFFFKIRVCAVITVNQRHFLCAQIKVFDASAETVK